MNLIEKAVAIEQSAWTDLWRVNPEATGDWKQVVTNVINILLLVAGAIAIVYLIYSGILYLTAAGNPDAAKKGQQGLINAIIGIIIITLVFFILRVAMNFAGSVSGT